MESSKIIVIATTIAIIFENTNVDQLKTFGGYTGDETISEAFLHAFDNIIIPKDRQQTSNAVGYLYDYLDHLFAAANFIHKYKPLVNPVFWCLITLPKNVVLNDVKDHCMKEMRNAGFKDTAEETISEFLYFRNYNENMTSSQKGYYDYIKYSMANAIDAVCPKDFCDKIESSPSQILVEQNVKLLSNSDGHTSINYTQPPTSTFNIDNEESLNIHINKLHLDDFEED